MKKRVFWKNISLSKVVIAISRTFECRTNSRTANVQALCIRLMSIAVCMNVYESGSMHVRSRRMKFVGGFRMSVFRVA